MHQLPLMDVDQIFDLYMMDRDAFMKQGQEFPFPNFAKWIENEEEHNDLYYSVVLRAFYYGKDASKVKDLEGKAVQFNVSLGEKRKAYHA